MFCKHYIALIIQYEADYRDPEGKIISHQVLKKCLRCKKHFREYLGPSPLQQIRKVIMALISNKW